jgi:hypothetical protein
MECDMRAFSEAAKDLTDRELERIALEVRIMVASGLANDDDSVPPFSLKFNPASISEYTEEGRQVDCTTVARAAEAGQLEFLKWCNSAGYAHCFDSTALGYAMHAGQREIAAWMLQEEMVDWHAWHSPYNQEHLVQEALLLGLDEALVARIPPCRYAA